MSAPLLTPGERLALSRERLRVAIANNAAQPPSPLSALFPGSSGWLDILKTALPGTGEVMDALAAWWKQATLRPLAERHPIALVAGALLAGAVLAWSRPWRWLFRPPLLAALGPTVLTSVLASGAVQSWILAMLAKETDPAPATEKSPSSGPSDTH